MFLMDRWTLLSIYGCYALAVLFLGSKIVVSMAWTDYSAANMAVCVFAMLIAGPGLAWCFVKR